MATILDIYADAGSGMVRHCSVADFPKRGHHISTSRDGALKLAASETEHLRKSGCSVRVFDTFTMDFTDYAPLEG